MTAFGCSKVEQTNGSQAPSDSAEPQTIAAPPVELDGGGSIGGSDFLDAKENAAWFLGDKTIRYCVEVERSFPLSQKAAETEIEKAFKMWQDYFAINEINKSVDDIPGARPFALKTQFENACSGIEDLTFYIGGTNALIARAKKKLRNPMGFVERTEFDVAKGWAKGFVWIANPKDIKEVADYPYYQTHFLVIILHELGHIYGNSHVADTVMEASAIELYNMGSKAISVNPEAHITPISIDGTQQLYPCVSNSIFSSSKKGCKLNRFEGHRIEIKEKNSAVEEWIGRKTEGRTQISITFDNPKKTAILSIDDSVGTEDFIIDIDYFRSHWNVEYDNEPAHCDSGVPAIFYQMINDSQDNGRCFYLKRRRGQIFSHFKKRNGEIQDIVFEFDGRRWLNIRHPLKHGGWDTFLLGTEGPVESIAICDIDPLVKDLEGSAEKFADSLEKDKTLAKPSHDLYFDVLSFHNRARFDFYTLNMLTPLYRKAVKKYEELGGMSEISHLGDAQTQYWKKIKDGFNTLHTECFSRRDLRFPD